MMQVKHKCKKQNNLMFEYFKTFYYHNNHTTLQTMTNVWTQVYVLATEKLV